MFQTTNQRYHDHMDLAHMFYLVGGWPTPLKNDGVKVRLDHHPNYWGTSNKTCSKPVYGFPYDFCPFKKWGGDPFSSLPPPVISEVPVFSATLPTIRPREESAIEPLPPAESVAKSASKAIPIWKTSGISHWELIKDNMYQYVLRFGVKDHVWCSVIYSSLKSYLVVQLLQVKPLRGQKPTTLCISSPRIGLVAT